MTGTVSVAACDDRVKAMIEKFSDPLWNDLITFWSLDNKCDKIKNTLMIISIVLTDAKKKFIIDSGIRHWLSELQDIAYDVDDLMDALQIEKQRRSKGMFPVRVVWDFLFSDNQVKFRYDLVKKIKKINKRLDKIMEEKNNFQLVERTILMEEHNERETISTINESDVYGRKEEKLEIISLLIHGKNNKKLSVLPILGIGGIGKTTLAQIVCNDIEIKKHFHPIIWVHVSKNFEVGKILQKIIECVSKEACGVSCLEAKQKKLRTMISETRFLIILDDVSNEDAAKWEALNDILLCGMAGSKILVTTRSERVAKIMRAYDQFWVDPLKFEYCWELFEKRAFRNIDDEEKTNLVNIGKDIVRKCKGLPLAAKHLGNLAGLKNIDWCTIRDNIII